MQYWQKRVSEAPCRETFQQLVIDRTLTPAEKLQILRPLVLCDWREVNGWAQDAYEDVLLMFPEDDPKVIEYYDYFTVGDDELCKAQREALAR